MLDNYKDVLSVNDLYDILPLGRNKIYALIKSGTIKSIRVDGRILIPKKNLIHFLEC